MPELFAGSQGIQIKNLSKSFSAREVISGLDLAIPQGAFVSLVGPSGCGKSTLLRLIAGLESPDSGVLQALSLQKGQIGFVFQEANLLSWRTALENVLLPLELSKDFSRLSKNELHDKARRALERVGLGPVGDLFPHELSGGMKMRVAIARALVTEPRLLLLDEPFAALDELTRSELQEQLRKLWQEEQMTLIFVTHSLSEAVFLGERVIMLKGPGAQITYDEISPLPSQRTESLRTTEAFNSIVRTLLERLHT